MSSLNGCDRGSVQTAQAQTAPPATQSAGETPNINPNLPLLNVDARHSMRSADASGTPYLIKAGPGIVMDGRQIVLSDPQHQGRRPNAVHVIYDGCEYSAPWPQKGAPLCTLDIQTLGVVRGSAFTGFEKGQRAAVGVGFETFDSAGGRREFREFWAAWVIFK
jgi:hypothetical protein